MTPNAVWICRLGGSSVKWAVTVRLTLGTVTIGNRTPACTGSRLGSVGETSAIEWTRLGNCVVSRISTVLFTEPLNRRIGLVNCLWTRVVSIRVRVCGLQLLLGPGLSWLNLGRLGVTLRSWLDSTYTRLA